MFTFLPSHKYKSTVLHLIRCQDKVTDYFLLISSVIMMIGNKDALQLSAHVRILRFFRFSFLLKMKESMEIIAKFELWITSTTSTVPTSNPTSFLSRPLSPVKILALIYLSVKAQLSGKILYFFLKYSQSMFSVSWMNMSIIIIFLFKSEYYNRLLYIRSGYNQYYSYNIPGRNSKHQNCYLAIKCVFTSSSFILEPTMQSHDLFEMFEHSKLLPCNHTF